jgi:hypothetical protein
MYRNRVLIANNTFFVRVLHVGYIRRYLAVAYLSLGRVLSSTLSLLALATVVSLSALGQGKGPILPKVPFSNKPCESLSPADRAGLKMADTVQVKPDRAPATLPFDNICTYWNGGSKDAQIGYQTKIDYDTNSTGNRSTTRKAPADLPGAFYDGQGGLWFTKNGYYVVVSGRAALREPVARLLAGKL